MLDMSEIERCPADVERPQPAVLVRYSRCPRTQPGHATEPVMLSHTTVAGRVEESETELQPAVTWGQRRGFGHRNT